MSARFSRDEAGVSEVLGYVLGFLMSFVLLTIALYGFKLVADEENQRGMETHFTDISNRIAAAVLSAAEIGANRGASDATALTDEASFDQRVRVPAEVRGAYFTVSLDSSKVVVTTESGSGVSESAPLYNLRVPTPGSCAVTDAVCTLSGNVRSVGGYVTVKYLFNRIGPLGPCTTTPANCITLE